MDRSNCLMEWERFARNLAAFAVGVFIAAALIFASCDAQASYYFYGYSSGGPYFSTANGACDEFHPHYGRVRCGDASTVDGGASWRAMAVLSGGSCASASGPFTCAWRVSGTCPSGMVDDGTGYCKTQADICASKKGTAYSSGFYDMGTSPTASPVHTACDGGCTTDFNGSFPVGRSLVGGVYHYFGQGSWTYDGTACTSGTSSGAAATSQPAPTCGTGQTMGQVNGQTVCLKSDGTQQDPNASSTPNTKTDSPTTTNPDGSTTKTSTQQNADGSTTTTTTNTATDGTQTTSSSTTNPDGTKQDPMVGFCQQNPGSPMCKGQDPFCKSNPDSIVCKKSSFGGSCGAFTCDGDAVQCAIAKKQYEENCTLFVTATPLSDLGNQVSSGSDPLASQFPTAAGNQTTTDVQSVFTQAQGSRWLGSADLPDVPLTTSFGTFVVPMSNWSNLFRVMGYILVAVAGVVAVRMVSSTVTG